MAAKPPQRRKGPRVDDPELKGRRSDVRTRVLLSASAEAISGHLQVTLLEVSITGARLTGPRLPAAGKDVMLNCGGIEMFGTIVWLEGGECGLQFDEAIGLNDLVALRSVSSAAEKFGLTP